MATKTTYNLKVLNKDIGKSRGFRTTLRGVLLPRIEEKQKQMLEEFETHPVTVEVAAGPNAPNSSGLLPEGYGNLFSFIGFNAGDKPINTVRSYLAKPARITKISYSGGSRYRIDISAPDKEELFDRTPIPWLEGRSWLDGIEHGISGFGQYLFSGNGFSASFSGTGIQTKGRVRSGALKRTSYVSGILNRFLKSLRQI